MSAKERPLSALTGPLNAITDVAEALPLERVKALLK
jgi:hypothetical protein